MSCGLCGHAVDPEETRIDATCSECGVVSYHRECVRQHVHKLIRDAKLTPGARERREVQCLRRPQDLFARNGTVQKLSVTCPVCKIGANTSADVMKPVRIAPAKPVKTTKNKKMPLPPPPPPQPRRRTHAAPVSHSPFPSWARMCHFARNGDECRIWRCEYCHTYEELDERRAMFLAQHSEACLPMTARRAPPMPVPAQEPVPVRSKHETDGARAWSKPIGAQETVTDTEDIEWLLSCLGCT